MKKTTLIFIIIFIFLIFFLFEERGLALNAHASYKEIDSEVPDRQENASISEQTSKETDNEEAASFEIPFLPSQLFNEKGPTEKISMTLGELFFLDRLFSTPENTILDQNRTSLGDILVLNQIFNNGNPIILGKYFDPQPSIGNLMVLNRLFGRDIDFLSDGTTLGNLLILNKIFFPPSQKVFTI